MDLIRSPPFCAASGHHGGRHDRARTPISPCTRQPRPSHHAYLRPDSAPSDDPIVVLDDLETAVQRARAAGLPVLVTFTSHTCINCCMMDVTAFEQPEIRALRAGYVEARLHTDAADEALRPLIADHTRTTERTGVQPVYVVLDPSSGSEIGRFAGAALGDTETFQSFLASPGGDS